MKQFYRVILLFLFSLSATASAQWTKEASTPGIGRDAACEFSIGNKIYYGGGYTNSNTFSEYDPATNTWTKKANLPLAPNPSGRPADRAFGLSFSIGSKGYVFGGQSVTDGTDQYGFDTEQASVTNDLWEYDPATDTWTQKASSPAAGRDGAMAFVINGKAYIGAGVNGPGYYLSDFWEYDPATNTWTQKADVPGGAIGFPIGFSVGTMGYMVGGGVSVPPYENTNAYSYDPSSDSWNPVSSFPGQARQAGVGFSIDTLGYVGLGQSQYSASYSDFYSYNPATDTWTKALVGFPDKIGLGWATAAVAGNAVYIGGGAELPSFNFSSSWYAWGAAVVPNLPTITLVAPPDQSTITSGMTMFQWQSVSDTTTYRIEISTSSTFSTSVLDSTLKGIASVTIPTTATGQYYWRVAAISGTESGPWSASRSFTVAQAGVGGDPSHTSALQIQTSPNPFTDFATISIELPQPTHLTLRVLDVLGRPLVTIFNGAVTAGSNSFQWKPGNDVPGSYYVQALTDAGIAMERMELVK